MADHNDPNAVNSIFSDIDVSAADVYDMFGFPGDDRAGEEKVVIALTFASVPETGVFDTDMLYRIQLAAHPRAIYLSGDDCSLGALLRYFDAVKDKYLVDLQAAEIRVTVDRDDRARDAFEDFPGGSFSTNRRDTPGGVNREASHRMTDSPLPVRSRLSQAAAARSVS